MVPITSLRKILQTAGEDRQDKEVDDRRDDHRADGGLDVRLGSNRQEDRDWRAARHHDERQPRSELPWPEALQQRAKAADQESGADQIDRQVRRKVQRLADDEDGRDRRGGHDKHVLQAEWDELPKRKPLIDRFDTLVHSSLLFPWWPGPSASCPAAWRTGGDAGHRRVVDPHVKTFYYTATSRRIKTFYYNGRLR